jgi:hypothetical protein
VTTAVGLDFSHGSSPSDQYRLPEIMGSGAAVFDFDNDGQLDVFLVDSTPGGSRLFKQADGQFTDVTTRSGIHTRGIGMGAAIGDVDNDGDIDLYVTAHGPDQLFRNNGDGSFTDATSTAGLGNRGWSTSAAFCDVDDDGYLDLYVATYVADGSNETCTTPGGARDYCPPNVYPGVPDELYLNTGDGVFRRAEPASRIGQSANRALGVICSDLNADHHDDIVVANDGEPNHLWLNQGDGTFVERGVHLGLATNLFGEAEASMGIAVGDVNGDLELDLFMTHIDRESNTLYTTTPEGTLLDTTIGAKLGHTSMPFTGFGAALLDADNDTDLDLAIANGRVRKPSQSSTGIAFQAAYAERNLFLEQSEAEFTDACGAKNAFCHHVAVSRGLLATDIDGDGDLDLLVTNSNGPAKLYRNDSTGPSRGIRVRAVNPEHRRDAIGANVRARTAGGWFTQPVLHSRSYLSSSDAAVHFGLGNADHVDEFIVTWPDGARESFSGALDQETDEFHMRRTRVLQKGAGQPVSR